jgi:eukaryotic-like serine/threonine-protein kinase
MTLINKTIANYEVISKIGEGGMGEVYRARDTKLGRDVAIKVLPAAFSADAERLRRFEQEAQAAGALNHPNILVIFHIGTHDGAPYIVSELLEGETLREWMAGAALPQRKAMDYALQIAHGLAAAHAKGIVHRDLKPENLFVTNDGRVKILDFGLAKLTGTGDGTQSQTEVPTRKVNTDPGMVMGTMGYMSPEQLKGRSADHRSDIFSFGAILYEMLSGKRAFRGDSMAETMSAILREDPPDLSESNKTVSPALERVVHHCLEKSPEERFHSTRDLAFAIESLSGTATSSGQTQTMATLPALRPRTRERIGWIALTAMLLVAAVAVTILYSRRSQIESPSAAVRFTLAAPENVTMLMGPIISPDGRNLIFAAQAEGKTSFWLRPLGSLAAHPLPGTELSSEMLFWSPDSRSICFPAEGKLKKIDLSGGPPQTLCNVPGRAGGSRGGGGTWSRDGVILFTREGMIYRVSATGGEPTPVLGDQSNPEITYRWPYFLPDGRHFVYLRTASQQATPEIYLGSLDSKETTRLLATNSQAIYAASATGSGHLILARAGSLLAQPFDAATLKLTGEPLVIADQVSVSPNGTGYFSASDNGILVYDPTSASENQQLTWVDRAGKLLEPVGAPGIFQSPKLSPEGKRVAVARRDLQTGTNDIYVMDLARGASSRLTSDPANDYFPIWSPDGNRIVFGSNRGGKYQLYQKLASGVGPEELLLASDVLIGPHSWSADGRFILYTRTDPKTGPDVWVLPLEGDRQPFLFLQTQFIEGRARFSPDGRWIAYASNEGRNEVYVQTWPASGAKWPVTNDGSEPQWRGDSKELFYTGGGKMWAVEVKPGRSFEAGVPKALFDLAPVRAMISNDTSYTVTADGQRFLFVSQAQETPTLQYTVVVNWMADLKK